MTQITRDERDRRRAERTRTHRRQIRELQRCLAGSRQLSSELYDRVHFLNSELARLVKATMEAAPAPPLHRAVPNALLYFAALAAGFCAGALVR